MKNIKIGDTVRFLSSKGEGIVRRIDKNVVWVEGEDGFELPTPIKECIVVDKKDTYIPAYKTPQELREKEKEQHKIKAELPISQTIIEEPEREDGDQMSVYLAWLPEDFANFGSGNMEAYLINDTNYTLLYTYGYLNSRGEQRNLSSGEIERETRLLVDTFDLSELVDREHLFLSLIAYKEGKNYLPKPLYNLRSKINKLKFFKRHCFVENDFFDEDALLLPLIEKDVVIAKEEEVVETLLQNSKLVKEEVHVTNEPIIIRKKESMPIASVSNQKFLEIDLHIEKLLPSLQGVSSEDILDYQLEYFRSKMNENIRRKGLEIIFIHGQGDGVLRKAIVTELQKSYSKCRYEDANVEQYGFGATKVEIC